MTEKTETITRMTETFNELMNTSISSHSMMAELYRIVSEDLKDDIIMRDLMSYHQNLSEV